MYLVKHVEDNFEALVTLMDVSAMLTSGHMNIFCVFSFVSITDRLHTRTIKQYLVKNSDAVKSISQSLGFHRSFS